MHDSDHASTRRACSRVFAPVGSDGWPARMRLPAFTLSREDLEKAKAKTAQLLRPRTPVAANKTDRTPVVTAVEVTVEAPPTSALPHDGQLKPAEVYGGPEDRSLPAPSPSAAAETTRASQEATAEENTAQKAALMEAPAITNSKEVRHDPARDLPMTARKRTQGEPRYVRLYDDAKRIEAQRQARAKALQHDARHAERQSCTFSPVISPRALKQRQQHQRPASPRADCTSQMREVNTALNNTVMSTGNVGASPSPSPAASPAKRGRLGSQDSQHRQPDERDPSQVVFERLYSEAERRAERLSKKRAASVKAVENQKGEACMFHPQISPHARRSHHYESFDDFLSAQEEHRLVSQNRQRRLTEQILEAESGGGRRSLSVSAGAASQPSPRQSRGASRSSGVGVQGGNPIAMKLKAALEHDPRYKGPVTGWHEHAEQYWRARNGSRDAHVESAQGQASPRVRAKSQSQGAARSSSALHNRLHAEQAQREASRQCIALAQLEKEHAELFRPRLGGTEAFTSRRRRDTSRSSHRPEGREEAVISAAHAVAPRSRASAGGAETVFEDLYEQGVALQHKKNAQRLSEEETRLSECTFTPHINPHSERILVDLAVKIARGDTDTAHQNDEVLEEGQSGEGRHEDGTATEAGAGSSSTKGAANKKASMFGSLSPQLHLLRLAQYRRQSAAVGSKATAGLSPSPSKRRGTSTASPPASSPRSAAGLKTPTARKATGASASADFLDRNAALLQRRRDHADALRRAEEAEDIAHCTFRPVLAPLTELMAEDQQRYLQIIDSPEMHHGNWRRQEGSPSRSVSSASLRQRTTSAAQKIALAGRSPSTSAGTGTAAAAHVAPPQPASAVVASSLTPSSAHRPRVIPVAVTTPYGSGGMGSSRRSASVRSSLAGGSREGTPLRERGRSPLHAVPHRTPLQALADGTTPVVLDEHDGWVTAGAGSLSSDDDANDATRLTAAQATPKVETDFLRTLEAEVDATLEMWSGVA